MARIRSTNPEEELREGFRYFDKDGSGFVDAAELRYTLTTLGDTLSDEQAEDFFKQADINEDGKISYEGIDH